jgi:ABC-type nitrate/sulfonate/bicarbonate transport system substrate-binding protein
LVVSQLILLSLSPASAAESKKISFAYSSIGSMATGVWMAKESGAFEKNGIHAEIILSPPVRWWFRL